MTITVYRVIRGEYDDASCALATLDRQEAERVCKAINDNPDEPSAVIETERVLRKGVRSNIEDYKPDACMYPECGCSDCR